MVFALSDSLRCDDGLERQQAHHGDALAELHDALALLLVVVRGVRDEAGLDVGGVARVLALRLELFQRQLFQLLRLWRRHAHLQLLNELCARQALDARVLGVRL